MGSIGKVMGLGVRCNNFYELSMCIIFVDHCTNTKQWHERLGHLNVVVLKEMEKSNIVVKFLALSSLSHVCDARMMGKPIPKESRNKIVSSTVDTC